MCCVPTARRVATKKLNLLKPINDNRVTYKSNRAALANCGNRSVPQGQGIQQQDEFIEPSQAPSPTAVLNAPPLVGVASSAPGKFHNDASQDPKTKSAPEAAPSAKASTSEKPAAVEPAKKKRKRIRKKLKPGLTAKNQERQFVKHNYHDHANDTPDVSPKVTSAAEHGTGSNHSSPEPFPFKLHVLLDQIEADGHADVVSWQPHGRAFVIHQKKTFVEDIMPKYFKQTKLTSFQRQLNLYGYTRISRGTDSGGYYHELFLRGMPHLCHAMVRIKCKGTGFKAASDPDSEPNFYTMPFVLHGRRAPSEDDVAVEEKTTMPPCVTSDDDDSHQTSTVGVEPCTLLPFPQVDETPQFKAKMQDNKPFLMDVPFQAAPCFPEQNNANLEEQQPVPMNIGFMTNEPAPGIAETALLWEQTWNLTSVPSFEVHDVIPPPPAYDYFSSPEQIPSLGVAQAASLDVEGLASDYDWVGFSRPESATKKSWEQENDDEAIFQKILGAGGGNITEDGLLAKLENVDADDDEALGHLLDMIVE